MATFQFFNFGSQRLTTKEYIVNSPEELKKVIVESGYFHDKLLLIRIFYWGVDNYKKKDSYTVSVRFLNYHGKQYNRPVGRIDESFAEVEA